jgi:SOS-response transcriptional repressor LexA
MAKSFNNPIKFVSSESHLNPGEMSLDLESYLISNPSASFFMRVESSRYERFSFKKGDVVLLDRAVPLSKTSIVVSVLDDQFTIQSYEELSRSGSQLWAVVKAVIRKL